MKAGALRGSLTPHLPHPPPDPTSSLASSPWMPCPLPPAPCPLAPGGFSCLGVLPEPRACGVCLELAG